MYNKGNVVTVMFLNGMELIGTLVSEGEDVVVIDKPMLCQATKNGVSFTPAISLTGDVVEGELELAKRNVMYILNTLNEISASYTKRLSDIITSDKATIIA